MKRLHRSQKNICSAFVVLQHKTKTKGKKLCFFFLGGVEILQKIHSLVKLFTQYKTVNSDSREDVCRNLEK